MDIFAFISTPHGELYKVLKNRVIKPVLEQHGIIIKLADDIIVGERISDMISEMISSADIVICDVSESNPSVCFEIGLARAQKKNIIILRDSTSTMPTSFDGMYSITYNSSQHGWERKLSEQLDTIIRKSEFSNRTYEFNEESSLDIYIQYKRLSLSEITGFLHNLDLVHQSLMSATSQIYYVPEIEQAYKNTLLVDRAYTGNSINFSFKEGWLPEFHIEDHDLDIQVPKNLGIPALAGIALLTSAQKILDVNNKYLDSQIKNIELQLKRIEYSEKIKVQPDRTIKTRANKTVKQLSTSTNISYVEINNIQIIGEQK